MNSTAAGKYDRGSVTYFRVLADVIQAAESRVTITYQDLAPVMGLPSSGSDMGKKIGKLLDDINDDEHRRGRPLVSAVVVGTSGRPGEGFFALANTLGKLRPGESPMDFWRRELAAVYSVWADAGPGGRSES